MSVKRERVVAWALCLISITGATVGAFVNLLGQDGAPGMSDLREVLGWGWALPVVFSVIAALIVSRQPRNRVGWLLMIPALLLAIYSGPSSTPPAAFTPALWLHTWFDMWSWIAVLFPIFLIPLHFPTGRPPSPRWRWVNWLAIGLWVLFMVIAGLTPTLGPLDESWRLPNPLGVLPQSAADNLMFLFPVGLVLMVGGSVVSLLVRYRRSGLIEREQIKWLLYAGALLLVLFATSLIGNNANTNSQLSALTDYLLLPGVLALGVAIGISILRYRLFDIDVVIRKTAVYGVLTGLLALVYFGSVLFLQTAFESVLNERSPLILVVSTLLIAALFAPLRRRVQSLIDRRFYRSKYDAQQVLARFTQTAREETDIEALTAELLAVVRETMQPGSVSLWTFGSDERSGQR